MFLFFGISKLIGGLGGFVFGLQARFAESPLPAPLVTPFVSALPFAAGVLQPWGIVLASAVAAVLMSASTVIVAINAQLLRRAVL